MKSEIAKARDEDTSATAAIKGIESKSEKSLAKIRFAKMIQEMQKGTMHDREKGHVLTSVAYTAAEEEQHDRDVT